MYRFQAYLAINKEGNFRYEKRRSWHQFLRELYPSLQIPIAHSGGIFKFRKIRVFTPLFPTISFQICFQPNLGHGHQLNAERASPNARKSQGHFSVEALCHNVSAKFSRFAQLEYSELVFVINSC